MKLGIAIFVSTAALIFSGFLRSEEIQDIFAAPLEKNELVFIHLGYSGVVIRVEDQIILIDPADLPDAEILEPLKNQGVDLLLYTHGHGDHLSLPTAQKIFEGSRTQVAADPSVTGLLQKVVSSERLTSASPGKSFKLGKMTLDAVQGKHVGPITLFRITVGNIRIFHGGDSADVPLGGYTSDIAFLPTGAPSPTASPENAYKMAADLKPKIVVAIHGSDGQNTEFKNMMNLKFPDVEVIIPEKGKPVKVSLQK